MLFKTLILTMTCALTLSGQPLYAEGLSTEFKNCIMTRATAILTNSGSSKQKFAAFSKHTSFNELGKRAYGGRNWENLSKKDKNKAFAAYYNTFIKREADPNLALLRDTVKFLTLRGTTRGDKLFSHLVQIVVTVEYTVKDLKTGSTEQDRKTYAFILVRSDCKMVDVGSGGFASRFINLTSIGIN